MRNTEKKMALERMLVDAGKYLPEIVPTLERALWEESHARECRDLYNKGRKNLRDLGIKKGSFRI